jgi:DNA-binding transcriptional LysR family regulator
VDVELRQLRCVVAVADARSFTAAGRQLHLTQQSVAAQVQRLERALGVTLFDRTTRRVAPTAACEALLPSLRSALTLLDRALAQAQHDAARVRPLRLAVSPSAMFGALQELLDVLATFGLPEPEVRQVWSDELPAAVLDGRFDAALAVELGAQAGLEAEPWRQQRVDLLVAEEHPFAGRDSVAVAALADQTLVLPGRTTSSGWHARFGDALARACVQPTILDAPRLAGPAPTEVVRGAAVTVWLSAMHERYVPNGLVRVGLRDPEIVVTTNLVVPAAPDPAIAASVEQLRRAVEHTRRLSTSPSTTENGGSPLEALFAPPGSVADDRPVDPGEVT